MTHKEKAEQLMHQKYLCSQIILGTFADDLGLDLKTALKIGTCFGMGMRRGEICGCISASLIVLGLAMGSYDAHDKTQEIYCNKKMDELIRRFSERMDGATNCRDILGKNISQPEELAAIRKEGLILRKCPNAIYSCIEILEELLSEFLKDVRESSINLQEIPETDEIHVILKEITKLKCFRRNVSNSNFAH